MTVAADDVLARHGLLEIGDALREHVARQRWFGGKERSIAAVSIEDVAEISAHDPTFLFVVARVHYEDGGSDCYNIPLGIRDAGHPMAGVDPKFLITTVNRDGTTAVVYDALADNDCSLLLWADMVGNVERTTAQASLRAEGTGLAPLEGSGAIRLFPAEQSNTALSRGNDEFLKWVRHIDSGPSIELEMIDALRQGGFIHMAETLGGIDYLRRDEPPTRIAFLQRYLHNASEGWAMALTSLRDLYTGAEEDDGRSPSERRAAVAEQGPAFTPEAARLGEVTAEMHLALSWPGLSGDVAPVPITDADLGDWATAMTQDLDKLLELSNPRLEKLRAVRGQIVEHFDALRHVADPGVATRIHGDYHLGQVLRTDLGWIVIDFEGEPARPSAERRLRWSPLRDVAGMLRSFDYAAAAALAERTSPDDPAWEELSAQGDAWAQANRDAFWQAYVARIGNSSRVLPRGDSAMVVRRAFEVQKAVYEVLYELGHRPEWVNIPLRFLLRLRP